MRIILFRHGHAEQRDPSRWPDDSARPLTARGEKRTRLAGLGLARLERGIDRLITSPYVRADQTARILSRVLEIKTVETLDALAIGGSAKKIIDAIHSRLRADTVVLVGHQPDLGAFAGLLLFEDSTTVLPFKKAGACCIEFESAVRPGGGNLEWFAGSGVLGRLGRGRVPA